MMNLVVLYLITYVVVLVIALVITAVFCPRDSNLCVTFRDAAPVTALVTTVMVGITITVVLGIIYIWGNLYHPQHCHSCGEPITDVYYQVDNWRWHPGCFTESATYHSEEVPSWQFSPEQEAPSDPTMVNSSTAVENTIERISGIVEGAQVKFNQGEVV